MKIYTNGARFHGGQLDRIDRGLTELGHQITPFIQDADLVYSQDSHSQVLRDKAAGALRPGAKVILCCLDVPEHLFGQGYNVNALAAELRQADAVVTISQFGQWQVQTYCGLDSTVIWNPIKQVRCQRGMDEKALWRFMHCGRRADFNKRVALGVQALQLLGYGPQDLLLVGNEPGWGDWRGVLDDRGLEIAYNSVDFVLATSLCEGLCLPVIETMAVGAVPVVCRDLSTREELLPTALFPEFAAVEPNPASVARFIAGLTNEDGGQRLADLKDRLHTHYVAHWADRTSPTGVARAILGVYDTLT